MNAERYVEIIMQDERDEIAAETPTVYEDNQIERVYEFRDGESSNTSGTTIRVGNSITALRLSLRQRRTPQN